MRRLSVLRCCCCCSPFPPPLLPSPRIRATPQRRPASSAPQRGDTDNHPPHPLHEIDDAMIRLPLAAALGAALALRPRRRGTPPRDPAVIQTQIILAVVGAVIMLVVGASLARAFGIVGAANLIRYRSKIDDPKDAVVMLCALAVGLASGVGLYALAVFSTVFIVAALWVIESFEPRACKRFELKIKAGKDTDAMRPKIEEILRRFKLKFELRTSSDEEVCYDVQVPLELQTDRVSQRHPASSIPRATRRSSGPRRRPRTSNHVARRETDHPAGRRPDAAAAGRPSRQEEDRHRHLPLRPRRAREGARGGGRARRRRPRADRAHQPRRREEPAQARAATARRRASPSRAPPTICRATTAR